jgi:DNA anti-recombination protein RmuC
MAVMARESWSDGRIDEFKENVNRRFDEVDKRFDEVDRRFGEVDRRFDEVDRRFDKVEADMREGFARVDNDIREVRGEISQIHFSIQAMQRAMTQGVIGICGVMITGFGVLIGISVF